MLSEWPDATVTLPLEVPLAVIMDTVPDVNFSDPPDTRTTEPPEACELNPAVKTKLPPPSTVLPAVRLTSDDNARFEPALDNPEPTANEILPVALAASPVDNRTFPERRPELPVAMTIAPDTSAALWD